MNAKQEKAVQAVRDTLHDHCKDMSPDEYEEVLGEISADIEGNLEALKNEAEGE